MADRQIIFFEDGLSRTSLFKPLSYAHAIAELRVGIYTMIESLVGENIIIHTRKELAPVIKERYPNLKVN